MTRLTRTAHRISVVLMGIIVLTLTGDGFVHSYDGLLDWATEQGLTGWKRDSFPLLVDLFILAGELGLFTLSLEGHRVTRRALSWVDMALPFGLVCAGWGVSLAMNVGAVDGIERQLTAAVAPVASMLGLLVMLRTVHRLVTRPDDDRPVAEVDQTPGRTVAEVADDGWPVADRPDDEVAEVDGYALWELVPATVPDGWPITLGQVADRPDGAPEPVPVDGHQHDGGTPDPGQESGHQPDGPAAGQPLPVDLESAMRSARARGRSVRAIAKEFGVSRHRAAKATAGVPARVNGHPVAD